MNKETVKGAVNDAVGRAKRQTGEWTGDVSKQVEGAAQQVKGKAEKAVGHIKDAAHDAKKQMERDSAPTNTNASTNNDYRNRDVHQRDDQANQRH